MNEAGSIHKEDRRLWRAVEQVVRPFPLTIPSAKLLVGVSGGADSLALLHLLWQRLGAERLMVAHLNHQLRPEADEEARFVQETAASWHVPFKLETVDVAELAEKHRLSLEAAGRWARYRFLAETAVAIGAAAVVVAHHADDQAETVLLHLLRGSGSGGLRGMQAVSLVPGSEAVVLLRPFLTTSRADIEAYCSRHKLAFRQDASNEDMQFARNRIRHELLPLLQTYNPQIQTRFQQLATITADEYAALQAHFDAIWPELLLAEAENGIVLDRQKFAAQLTAWQRLALRRAVRQLRPFLTDISFETVELARTLILKNQSGTEVMLPGELRMQVAASELIFGEMARLAAVPQLLRDAGALLLPVPGKVALRHGWVITAEAAEAVSLAEIEQNGDPWRAFVALGEGEALWIRPFQPNERLQPLGLGGQSQKIADLLSNRKVARAVRPLWPIVATAEHPVWVVGCQVDERVRVQQKTLRLIKLTCLRGEGL
ncbi:MAG: tRNA lysidine(34) synthetase TilS [Chloroflexota bacterium]